MIPAYEQNLKQEAPVTLSIKKWSDQADAKLQDYFVSTDEICSRMTPMTLRSTPHLSLASSRSASMTSSPQYIPQPEHMDYRQHPH